MKLIIIICNKCNNDNGNNKMIIMKYSILMRWK